MNEVRTFDGLNYKDAAMKYVKIIAVVFLLCLFSNAILAQLTYNELKVEYDSAWTFKNLKIIPVRYKDGDGAGVIKTVADTRPMMLSEALLKHKIKLHEMKDKNGADVNLLQVTNRSRQEIVIQSGEILGGGKQDRMVGETKILPAGSKDYLKVFCVEKRRWSDKPKAFRSAGVANSDLQKTMNTKKRQADVWREIDRQFSINNKKTETYSYVDLYKNTVIEDTDYIRYFLKKYSETDSNFAGYVFLTGIIFKFLNVHAESYSTFSSL